MDASHRGNIGLVTASPGNDTALANVLIVGGVVTGEPARKPLHPGV